jgi:hypothetical protein
MAFGSGLGQHLQLFVRSMKEKDFSSWSLLLSLIKAYRERFNSLDQGHGETRSIELQVKQASYMLNYSQNLSLKNLEYCPTLEVSFKHTSQPVRAYSQASNQL